MDELRNKLLGLYNHIRKKDSHTTILNGLLNEIETLASSLNFDKDFSYIRTLIFKLPDSKEELLRILREDYISEIEVSRNKLTKKKNTLESVTLVLMRHGKTIWKEIDSQRTGHEGQTGNTKRSSSKYCLYLYLVCDVM